MKRFVFLLIIGCCYPLSRLQAQVGDPRRDLAIGVSGGYTLNQISFSPTIKQSFHQGFTAGFTARYMCEKYFAAICGIQGELNYTQLGWKEKIETSTDTYSRTINYIQLPILLHMGFGKEQGGVKGFLVLGPELGYCIGESEKRGGEWSERTLSLRPNQVVQQYDKKVERNFQYGLTGGIGMEVSTRNGHHFLLEGRYFYALSDIFNNSKKDTFGRSANGAIIAKISYLFDILRTKKN